MKKDVKYAFKCLFEGNFNVSKNQLLLDESEKQEFDKLLKIGIKIFDEITRQIDVNIPEIVLQTDTPKVVKQTAEKYESEYDLITDRMNQAALLAHAMNIRLFTEFELNVFINSYRKGQISKEELCSFIIGLYFAEMVTGYIVGRPTFLGKYAKRILTQFRRMYRTLL